MSNNSNAVSNNYYGGKPTGIYVRQTGGNGLDATINIQLLLMRDCDEQLRDLGNQIKANNMIKKEYRKQIQGYRAILLKPGVDENGKKNSDDSKNTYRTLTPAEARTLIKPEMYFEDPQTHQILSRKTNMFGQLSGSKKGDGPTVYSKQSIETMIENISEEKDNLTEANDMISMTIQSLTNTRKIAIETASNCLSKGNEGASSIVRNMRS